jgi:hypothetical protein
MEPHDSKSVERLAASLLHIVHTRETLSLSRLLAMGRSAVELLADQGAIVIGPDATLRLQRHPSEQQAAFMEQLWQSESVVTPTLTGGPSPDAVKETTTATEAPLLPLVPLRATLGWECPRCSTVWAPTVLRCICSSVTP